MGANTYRPLALAETWRSVVEKRSAPRLIIGDFLDDWRRLEDVESRAALVHDVVDDSDEPDIHRWSAFVAALVEYLTVRDGLPTPDWVFEERWILAEPWFLNPYWKLRAWLLVATPPPWKRRRIFGGDETMMIGRV